MRGQGALFHRLLPSNIVVQRGVKRQFQHPSFSSDAKYVCFSEIHFRDAEISRSNVLIYEVPKDPKVFGQTDSMPLFDSGELPGAPFYLRFAPDDNSLAMLCTDGNNRTNGQTTLALIEWSKFCDKNTLFFKDNKFRTAEIAASRVALRKTYSLMKGSPIFFTYTISDPKNATIVAHSTNTYNHPKTGEKVTEKAVWILRNSDTGGVLDSNWEKLFDCNPSDRWSAPACHAAGGGDSVLGIQDGWLVSRSISRWKRGEDKKPRMKKLIPIKGQVQYVGSNVLFYYIDLMVFPLIIVCSSCYHIILII